MDKVSVTADVIHLESGGFVRLFMGQAPDSFDSVLAVTASISNTSVQGAHTL